MPRTSIAPARSWPSAGWTRPSGTPRTPFASIPTRSAIASCWPRSSRARERIGRPPTSTGASRATTRASRRGPSPRRASGSAPRSRAWASRPPGGPCGSNRATAARSWHWRRRWRAPATRAEPSRRRRWRPSSCPATRRRARRWPTPTGWPVTRPRPSTSSGPWRTSCAARPRARGGQGASLYRRRAGFLGRSWPASVPLFELAFARWLRIDR